MHGVHLLNRQVQHIHPQVLQHLESGFQFRQFGIRTGRRSSLVCRPDIERPRAPVRQWLRQLLLKPTITCTEWPHAQARRQVRPLLLHGLVELGLELCDVVLDEHEQRVRVGSPQHVQLMHKLMVVDCSSLIGVEHLEQVNEVALADVHRLEEVCEVASTLEAMLQLPQVDMAAGVLVQILEDGAQVSALLDKASLLDRDLLAQGQLARLGRPLHDASKEEVQCGQGRRHQHQAEEDRRGWGRPHDRGRHLGPTVSAEEDLRQCQHRRLHRGERRGATVATRIREKPLVL
mmetsp:Transcript_11262/g.32527  ORF Transcript_11262/g.32527 Transcript_11262/m.32527 type:complete len:290 (+) Transcript_11262:337-1206(+)